MLWSDLVMCTGSMLRPVILAAALASTTAFAPTASFAPRLRSAQATNVKMAMQPESKVRLAILRLPGIALTKYAAHSVHI